VLRHAKSAWDTDAVGDHDRPLNKRGKREAPPVAARIAELGWIPQRVVSSDAKRTRETWERMADAFEPAPEVVFTEALYHAGWPEVRRLLGEVEDTVDTLLLLGHNPGWEELVAKLSGDEVRMTTCNAALLSVEAESWGAAVGRAGSWTLAEVVRPKEL
jgi:phosphohistidine phosphatase